MKSTDKKNFYIRKEIRTDAYIKELSCIYFDGINTGRLAVITHTTTNIE